ncbi:MAG: hypothetical protein IPO20_19435 [Gammaproteobacteria bacterium]|nr:hypothetical protein [Gammaproteobacteria bacterium]
MHTKTRPRTSNALSITCTTIGPELLVEQGAIGFVLFGSAILIALGTMISALLRRRDPLVRAVLFGCVTATLSLLIHAFVDFNFHIPANAAWFSVILAMGLIASRMPHDT